MTHDVYLLYRLFKDSSTKSYGEEKPNRYSTNNTYSGARATLVASGLVSFVAALSLIKFDTKEIVLLILDLVSIFLLLILAFRQEIFFKLAAKLKKYYRT